MFVQLSCCLRMCLWPNLIIAHFHLSTHAVHTPPTHTHKIFHQVTLILAIVFIGPLVSPLPTLSVRILLLFMSGGSGFIKIMCIHRATVPRHSNKTYLFQPSGNRHRFPTVTTILAIFDYILLFVPVQLSGQKQQFTVWWLYYESYSVFALMVYLDNIL